MYKFLLGKSKMRNWCTFQLIMAMPISYKVQESTCHRFNLSRTLQNTIVIFQLQYSYYIRQRSWANVMYSSLFVCLSVCLFVCLSVCYFAKSQIFAKYIGHRGLSVCLYVCLYVCLSVLEGCTGQSTGPIVLILLAADVFSSQDPGILNLLKIGSSSRSRSPLL